MNTRPDVLADLRAEDGHVPDDNRAEADRRLGGEARDSEQYITCRRKGHSLSFSLCWSCYLWGKIVDRWNGEQKES